MSRGPLHDNRSGAPQRPEEPTSAFGPRGAALLEDLRRVPDVRDREFEGGGPRAGAVSPAFAEDENRVSLASKKRSASPDRRKEVSNGAMRAWLERLDIHEDGGDFRSVRAGNENTRAKPTPGPSILRFDAFVARQSTPPDRERRRQAATLNTQDLHPQSGELRSLRQSAEPGPQANSYAAAADPTLRKAALGEAARRLTEAAVGAAHAWLAHFIASCGRVIDYFRAPNGSDAESADLTRCLRHRFQDELRAGLRVLVLGVGLVGGWSVLVPLSGAVTVPGTLVVESSVKKIQYPAGGVIAEIRVHDGMRVKEGDLLVRIDETQLRANLQVISDQLDETRVRIARLTAELDGVDAPIMSGDSAAQAGGRDLTSLIASETSLFKARLGARENQKKLLLGSIAQLEEEIDGIDAQIKSKSTQLDLISSELKGVQALFEKQLVPLARVTALQRQAAQLEGERSQLKSTIAETRSKISQAQLEIVKIDQDLRRDAMKDLREAQDRETELAQKVVAARDQLNRVEIRAPSAGVVHQLTVHTIGGVIGAGEVIMEIVPDSDDLQIEARLPPVEIDQVHVGQDVLVRFSAFNQRTTPQITGVVTYVSADLTQDQQNKSSYYTIRVNLTAGELHGLGDLRLVSGMPAELFLQTGSRTMMSYLLKPITDQLKRTFREP
jgi:HlyD family secretion protein